MLKKLSILALLALACSSFSYASKEPSLEMLAAKSCREMAVQHALDKVGQAWGKNEIDLLHVDRSIPYGVDNDPSIGETAGYSNVSVVISRESADPVQYEMVIQASTKKGSSELKCKVVKEIQRDLL